MRIAFVTLEYPPRLIGGAGVYAGELCAALGALGHDITVFAPQSPGDGEFMSAKGVTFRPIPISSSLPQAPQFWVRVRKAISEEGSFDIIHLNSAAYWFIARTRLADCPQVMTLHHSVVGMAKRNNVSWYERLKDLGGENSPLLPIIERSCIMRSDGLIAVSRFAAQQAILTYPGAKGRMTVIPSGRGVPLPPPSLTPTEVRKKYSLSGSRIVLFVGRVDDSRKGLDVLIKAFAAASLPSASLLVVGKGDSTKYRAMAHEFGVEDRTSFTGYVEDGILSSIYQAADIVVVPSRLEGYGYTAVEPMLLGKPVLASAAGALPEIVPEPGLFSPEDHVRLASMLNEVLSCDDSLAKLSQLSIESASNTITYEEVARRTITVYAEMLE